MGYVTWPHPFQGHFDIRRLGLAMFNPHIKLEMSTITCNEEMKGHAKCKNFRFEPPFAGLRGNAHVHLWLAGKRVVDFLYIINIGRNCAVRKGVGHFERNFHGESGVVHQLESLGYHVVLFVICYCWSL